MFPISIEMLEVLIEALPESTGQRDALTLVRRLELSKLHHLHKHQRPSHYASPSEDHEILGPHECNNPQCYQQLHSILSDIVEDLLP